MKATDYYALRRIAGQCARCPNESLTKSRCMACRRKESTANAKRYQARKLARVLANHKARKEAA
jgi:hypothetical protein